jgi:tRNA(Ser,Leu) C12 N-acetylase TAN1
MAGEHPNFTTQAKVVATAHYQREWKRARSAIRRAIPGARLVRTGFTGVFVLEADGDCLEIAERLTRECSAYIGHATAVLAEEPSEEERLRAAAVRIGLEHVRPEESFCFRLRKRGSHALRQTTPRLEFELGSAIWDALQQRYGRRPKVDLKNPDVLVLAEVLGPVTALGIVRKDWTEPSVVPVETEMREGSRESPVR